MTTEYAKKVLKAYGYFVDNLWKVEDVQDRYECDEEKAQEILKRALVNEGTMERIWIAIDIFAEMDGLKAKE
jgi:hypothetical protein